MRLLGAAKQHVKKSEELNRAKKRGNKLLL